MLHGYSDRISASPGEALDLMVSTDQPRFTIEVVRLLHGDPNPQGPGYLEEKTDWIAAGPYPGVNQPLRVGSYISLPPPVEELADITFGCWIYPTAPSPCEQVVMSWGQEPALAMQLKIDPDWRLSATVSQTGKVDRWVRLGRRLFPCRWQFVGLTFEATAGKLGIFAGQRGATGPAVMSKSLEDCGYRKNCPACQSPAVSRQHVHAHGIFHADAPMLLGAHWRSGEAVAAFNGKIGRPILLAKALDDIGLFALQDGLKLPPYPPVLGEWDFSREIHGDRVVDISGRGRHGKAHNGPARGVTGQAWTGPHHKTYSSAPLEYDAIHLHDDDLEDANWKPSATLKIPHDARSGIYSARLRAGEEVAWLSFVVRPRARREARVLFIAPTITWQAYSNRAEPDEHETGLSLYTNHYDGSANYYTTLHKPQLTLAPTQYFEPRGLSQPPEHRCCHLVMADLYTVHWLEQTGVAYDVIAEHDLHFQRGKALEGYEVVISAGHPEYWTEEMLNDLEHYLQHGGKVMYIGGNGMYWVTSIDPRRPHIIEVRRRGGTGVAEAEPGELQHSTTLQLGGTWRYRGRAPQRLVGVGLAACGFTDKAAPFRRNPHSFDPRAAFIFDGVGKDELIGDFGLNQGAAAGFETDRADHNLGTPDWTLVVASSFNHAPSFYRVNEEGVARGGQDPNACADMVYFERPGGGAVFAAGSITWSGSLSHNGYDNNVNRISMNVLRHFLGHKVRAS